MVENMRALLLAIALIFVTFAGCLTGGSDLDDGGTDGLASDGPVVIDFVLRDCQAVVGVVHVAPDRIQPHLPAGWTVAAPESQGGPDDPRGDAALGVEVFKCAEATAGNLTEGNSSSTPDAAYGSYWTWVEPPEEYHREGVLFHFWKWDTMVGDAALHAELLAAGLPMKTGSADWDGDTNSGSSIFLIGPNGPSVFHVSLAWEEGVIGFNGVAQAPFEPKQFSFVEFQHGANGTIVEWHVDVDGKTVNIGSGYVKFNVGTWGDEVTQLERTPAYFFAAEWTFAGQIIIPPAAANGTLADEHADHVA